MGTISVREEKEMEDKLERISVGHKQNMRNEGDKKIMSDRLRREC